MKQRKNKGDGFHASCGGKLKIVYNGSGIALEVTCSNCGLIYQNKENLYGTNPEDDKTQ